MEWVRLSSAIERNRTHIKIIGQSNSIERLSNTNFLSLELSRYNTLLVFFVFLRPHNMIFVQANLFTERNPTQSNRLSSIGAEVELTQCLIRSTAEVNRTQSTDWLWLSSISERSVDYTWFEACREHLPRIPTSFGATIGKLLRQT